MLVDFSNMFRNSVAVNIVTFPAMDSIVFSSIWSLSYFSRSNGNSIRILDLVFLKVFFRFILGFFKVFLEKN